MADDRTALLKRRAEQANQKYALLREGLEPEIADDVLGVVRWRPSRQAPQRQQVEGGDRIPFHVPMIRAHRLATAEGETSFHFAHSFINKVSTERMEDGRRNRRARHGRTTSTSSAKRRWRAWRTLSSRSSPHLPQSSRPRRPTMRRMTMKQKKMELPPVEPVVDPKELTPDDPFYSETLKSLAITHPEMMPNPVPICVSCPASNCYVIDDTLSCWCKELRKYPWTPGRSLPLCDSRRPARDAMLARKRQ